MNYLARSVCLAALVSLLCLFVCVCIIILYYLPTLPLIVWWGRRWRGGGTRESLFFCLFVSVCQSFSLSVCLSVSLPPYLRRDYIQTNSTQQTQQFCMYTITALSKAAHPTVLTAITVHWNQQYTAHPSVVYTITVYWNQ